MTATWKTVLVFISSTFQDMQAERDYLVRFVFPKLREELIAHRIHLVDIDLRWGVTSEQDAMEICREIIDECRPRFLCILGGRYGWVPPGTNRSITADEVYYSALDCTEKDRGFAYFYFRHDDATAAMRETKLGEFREPPGSESQRKLTELKQAIVAAGLHPVTYTPQWGNDSRRLTGLKPFGEQVYNDLLDSMKTDPDLVDRFLTDAVAPPDEFAEETAAMEAFVAERSDRFVLGSREAVLEELLIHASSTGGKGYICLIGASGRGKSALLAHLSQHSTLNAQPSTLLIRHFVGASPSSADVRRTLRRLCHELKADCPDISDELPDDPDKLRVAFPAFLRLVCIRRRVVIVLDAVNQFDPVSPSAEGLHWLPDELPANARFILSALEGPALEDLRRHLSPREIELKPLTTNDSEAIIAQFLRRYRKRFEPEQRAALLAKTDAGMPLYLLAALEELRTLGAYEEISHRITDLPSTTHTLFTWILKRLANDDGFRDAAGQPVGPELVSRFAALLGASRYGLSQRELMDLLDAGDSQGNVAALLYLLRPYLMRRGDLLDFYHGQFRAAAEKASLETEEQRYNAHKQLADYFRGQADPYKNSTWAGTDLRGFKELCYHQIHAPLRSELEATLCELRFLEARCLKKDLFDLLRDCDQATRHHDLPDVVHIREALRLELNSLLARPELTTQAIYNRLIWFDNHPSLLHDRLETAYEYLTAKPYWLRADAELPATLPRGAFSIPFGITSSIQSTSLSRQTIAIATPEGNIEIRSLDYGEIVERLQLALSRLAAILMNEDGQIVATMDAGGIIRTKDGSGFLRVRRGETRMAYSQTMGIFAVCENGALVSWMPPRSETTILRQQTPAPLIALQIATDGQAVLYVAGCNPQTISHCTRQEGSWRSEHVPYNGPPALDAKVNWETKHLLLACQDRCLRILDLPSGSLIVELSYEKRRDLSLRGIPVKCAWGANQSQGLIFLATQQGQIAAWDWEQGAIQPLGNYRTVSEPAMICLFEVLPQGGQLLMTFPDHATIVPSNNIQQRRRHHLGAVCDCTLTGKGQIVSIGEDRAIRWHSTWKLTPMSVQPMYQFTPSAIATVAHKDMVLVGTKEGQVWWQKPNATMQLQDIDQVFAEPIVSLFATSTSRAILAAKSGSIRSKNSVSNEEKVLWHARHGQHQLKIMPAMRWGLYWSFYIDEIKQANVLALVTAPDQETIVSESHRGFSDIAVSSDGSSFCLAGETVEVWVRSQNSWICFSRRTTSVRRVAFLKEGSLLVVELTQPSWLEVWLVAKDLPTVAAVNIPGSITCLAAAGYRIVLGLRSGNLVSLCLQPHK